MKRHFALSLSMLSLLSLNACTVGPDYNLPFFDLPFAWHQPHDMAVRDKNVVWWEDFNDEDLNELIEQALANNENLKIAAARVMEARGTHQSVEGALYPQVGASGGATRENPGSTTGGKPVSIFQASFDASWEIDLFGGNRRRIEAEEAGIGSAEAAYRDAALSLVAEVAREYITLRQYQLQLDLTRKTTDIQKQLYDISSDRFEGGLVSTLDVAQAETLYKTTTAKIPDYERLITASSYRLSVLLGEQPGSMDTLVKNPAPVPTIRELPVLDEPAEVVRRRPDIAQAERNLAAATAMQGVAVAELYPKISLSALLGIQHSKISSLNETWKIWDVGTGLAVPILEFGTIRGQIKAADARQVQAFHQYRQTVLSALGDVETSILNLTKESQRHGALVSAGKSADHAVAIARDRYKKGFSDFTTVLQVEQERFSVQIDLIASQSNVAQDIIALHKALGENPAPAGDSTQQEQ